MRIHLPVLASLCLCANTALANCDGPGFLDRITDTERAQLDAAVAATPFPEGLFFRATRNDAQIILIGTIHVDTPALPALRAFASRYIEEADLLLVEATAAEESAMLAALATQPDMYLITEGPTLPELLEPAVWDQVIEAAEARQLPAFMVAQFQPWYLSLTLAIPPCAMAGIAQGIRGLDHLIMEDAAANDVPIAPLEPWNTLIDLMREGTFEEQIDQLAVARPPVDLQNSIYATMIAGYATGQTAQMWEASRIAVNHIPNMDAATAADLFAETEKGLLIDRNLAWIPVITGASADNPKLVVAAGAAHWPGEFGVLQLLENDGWTITRLD